MSKEKSNKIVAFAVGGGAGFGMSYGLEKIPQLNFIVPGIPAYKNLNRSYVCIPLFSGLATGVIGAFLVKKPGIQYGLLGFAASSLAWSLYQLFVAPQVGLRNQMSPQRPPTPVRAFTPNPNLLMRNRGSGRTMTGRSQSTPYTEGSPLPTNPMANYHTPTYVSNQIISA